MHSDLHCSGTVKICFLCSPQPPPPALFISSMAFIKKSSLFTKVPEWSDPEVVSFSSYRKVMESFLSYIDNPKKKDKWRPTKILSIYIYVINLKSKIYVNPCMTDWVLTPYIWISSLSNPSAASAVILRNRHIEFVVNTIIITIYFVVTSFK